MLVLILYFCWCDSITELRRERTATEAGLMWSYKKTLQTNTLQVSPSCHHELCLAYRQQIAGTNPVIPGAQAPSTFWRLMDWACSRAQDATPLPITEGSKAEILVVWTATLPLGQQPFPLITVSHLNTTPSNRIMKAVLWIIILSRSKEITHGGDNFK